MTLSISTNSQKSVNGTLSTMSLLSCTAVNQVEENLKNEHTAPVSPKNQTVSGSMLFGKTHQWR